MPAQKPLLDPPHHLRITLGAISVRKGRPGNPLLLDPSVYTFYFITQATYPDNFFPFFHHVPLAINRHCYNDASITKKVPAQEKFFFFLTGG